MSPKSHSQPGVVWPTIAAFALVGACAYFGGRILAWDPLDPHAWQQLLDRFSRSTTFGLMAVLLVTLAFVVFRGLQLYFRLQRLVPDRDDVERTAVHLEGNKQWIGNPILVRLADNVQDRTKHEKNLSIHAALRQEADEQITKLFQWLYPIRLAGNAAPALGLLGTLVGMAAAFCHLSQDRLQEVGFDPVATALSIALITSVIGITTRLIAMIGTGALESKIGAVETGLSSLACRFLGDRPSPAAHSPAATESTDSQRGGEPQPRTTTGGKR